MTKEEYYIKVKAISMVEKKPDFEKLKAMYTEDRHLYMECVNASSCDKSDKARAARFMEFSTAGRASAELDMSGSQIIVSSSKIVSGLVEAAHILADGVSVQYASRVLKKHILEQEPVVAEMEFAWEAGKREFKVVLRRLPFSVSVKRDIIETLRAGTLSVYESTSLLKKVHFQFINELLYIGRSRGDFKESSQSMNRRVRAILVREGLDSLVIDDLIDVLRNEVFVDSMHGVGVKGKRELMEYLDECATASAVVS